MSQHFQGKFGPLVLISYGPVILRVIGLMTHLISIHGSMLFRPLYEVIILFMTHICLYIGNKCYTKKYDNLDLIHRECVLTYHGFNLIPKTQTNTDTTLKPSSTQTGAPDAMSEISRVDVPFRLL